MSRRSFVAVVFLAAGLAASLAPALAEDGARYATPQMTPDAQLTPDSQATPGPRAAPDTVAPYGTPPALATPQDLVGKSVRDLGRGDIGAAARDDIKALRRGPLLIHGNYCGIGNRPGAPPVDDLDAACMRHDACTHTGAIPGCRCDDRLRLEASEIAQDPAARPDLRAIAAATAAGMAVLICR